MEYTELIEKLINKENVAFTRWGDGEWNCILEPSDHKGNCDGHKYFTSLSSALLGVLRSKPKYCLGMQNFAMRQRGDEINKILKENGLEDIKWANADIFHKASIKEQFDSFFEALKDRDIIFVSPLYLSLGLKQINTRVHVETRPQDCWLETDHVIDVLKNELKDKTNCVVLFCASMASNVWIDTMYNYNPHNTYLDMGSVFEPYVGKTTRSYHKDIIKRISA